MSFQVKLALWDKHGDAKENPVIDDFLLTCIHVYTLKIVCNGAAKHVS